MSDFQLGQRVTYTHPLKRVGTWDAEKRQPGKEWQHSSWAKDAEQQREGIVIGKRTLANGRCYWDEDGTTFQASEYFQAYLIATDMSRKPVHVRVENVRRAPTQFHLIPEDEPFLTAGEAERLAATAWLQGAAAGASVDMGFVPSDALERDLPGHLADQFRGLNPYTRKG